MGLQWLINVELELLSMKGVMLLIEVESELSLMLGAELFFDEAHVTTSSLTFNMTFQAQHNCSYTIQSVKPSWLILHHGVWQTLVSF
jgi:hypothetical protein